MLLGPGCTLCRPLSWEEGLVNAGWGALQGWGRTSRAGVLCSPLPLCPGKGTSGQTPALRAGPAHSAEPALGEKSPGSLLLGRRRFQIGVHRQCPARTARAWRASPSVCRGQRCPSGPDRPEPALRPRGRPWRRWPLAPPGVPLGVVSGLPGGGAGRSVGSSDSSSLGSETRREETRLVLLKP